MPLIHGAWLCCCSHHQVREAAVCPRVVTGPSATYEKIPGTDVYVQCGPNPGFNDRISSQDNCYSSECAPPKAAPSPKAAPPPKAAPSGHCRGHPLKDECCASTGKNGEQCGFTQTNECRRVSMIVGGPNMCKSLSLGAAWRAPLS